MKKELHVTDPEEAKDYFQTKMNFTTGPVELERMQKDGSPIKVIDVREADDYAKGHIPGAVNLPKEKWESLAGLDKNKINVLYCYSQVCHLAASAGLFFASKGYPVMELEGGWKTWNEFEMGVEK